MKKEGKDFCPVCFKERIFQDRYYNWYCKDCKSEWIILPKGTNYDIQLLTNARKRIII